MKYNKYDMHNLAVETTIERMSGICDIIKLSAEAGLFECKIFPEKDLELFVKDEDQFDDVKLKIKAIKQVLEDQGYKVSLETELKSVKGFVEYTSVVKSINISWY